MAIPLGSDGKPYFSGQPWTAERKAELVRLFDRGDDLQLIAETLGRSRAAIVSQLIVLERLTIVGHAYHYVHSVPWATFKEAAKK